MEISGILTKQGHKMKTWRRRHFELHENCLYYYMYDGGPLKGEFIIDENTTVQISNLRRHGFSLVKKNGTTLNMFADNAIDKDRWMKSFLKVIHRIKSSHAEVEESNNVSMRRQDMNATGDTYSISVHIIQAKDLAPKGSTDTYAKVHVDAQTAVTKVIKKELNPVWDEHFSFAWTSDLRFVRIEVWNDDPMHSSRDNFLGVIYVPILSLHPNSVSSLWYKLGKRSSRSNVRGEIKVSVSCNRPPDPYILKVLEDVQKIPELQTKAVDIIRNFEIDSTMDQKQDFESFDGSDLFPSCLPPIESESIEDLSLRVTLKPTLDKSTSASAEGLLILTNYRLVFVSHSRIAFGDDWTSTTSHSALSEELTCSIPLTMVVNLNIQAYYDGSSSQIEDALSIVTNDSRVFVFIFHGSRSQITCEDSNSAAQSQDSRDILGRRAISMQSAPKVELDSSEPSRFFAFERSLSNSTLSRGFLSQFRVGSRKNELQSCDELGYLEGKSSVEGPPSQRMHARILWRVINRAVEIHFYQHIHHDLLRLINFHEDEITMRHGDSLGLQSLGIDENVEMSKETATESRVTSTSSANRSFLSFPAAIRRTLSRNLLYGWNIYDPIAEFKRIGIPDAFWRISRVNENYSICSTYPSLLGVPESIDDDHLTQAALFRSRGRLPALSWRHPYNLCTLTRCSQPLVGLGQNRSHYDESLLDAINQAGTYLIGDDMINLTSSQYTSLLTKPTGNQSPANYLGESKNRPLIIIDARPKINAQANQAAGKGYELGKGYENCQILFMGIANIHAMRKSIDSLEELCCKWSVDDINWHKNVESTGWLSHVSRVLTASTRIVHCIAMERYSVLVHCSDGWDRTAQLTSLPMLMMDPFYRTYDGFMILIEKEWFSFGHKFADRLGWSEEGWHDEERSPVFHQFLDCVYQCVHQNPNIFEFNEKLLFFLATHVLSGWFGNIFSNCERDRISSGIMNSTISIWAYVHGKRSEFLNPYYFLYPHIWVPNPQVRRIVVWKEWFLRWHNQICDLSWKRKNEDFSEISDAPPRWMEDSAVKECCGCLRQFNFVRRRHHCRACGKIYCESCVNQTRIVTTISETIPVRCCNECIAIMDIQDGEIKNVSPVVSKRVGRPSAFSFDSGHQSVKRSSLKFRYSRPSITFDQYHPNIKKQDSSVTEEDGEEDANDESSEVLSHSTPSPSNSPHSSPRNSIEQDVSVNTGPEKRYSLKPPSSPLIYTSPDRPRSTSYVVPKSSLPLRTSKRYDKIKPNTNPLAQTIGNKNRMKRS